MKKIAVLVFAGAFSSSVATSAQAAQLQIDVAIPQVTEGEAHWPYVAVWIENQQEQPVRLVEIWRQKPDWLKDLRRFWRKIGRSDKALVDARTGATKGPGEYRLVWNGQDNQGVDVAPGKYVLVVEAARENGGRNMVKQAFDWNGSAVNLSIAAGSELGEIKARRVD